ncbi:family 43 glycosylhydrolase [Auraticoccus sp. F435]|uniref:Family 43 glycosylhydrolase n=1 Tax=Auraticoccus cholistanensis TaxID=2656650 RepID=A0A6A9UP92_9ACTN|nr:family 43 glycosylhydrolase [Auraticoccus cholistanensis]MVA74513.1 family 43 glycosylhydrolase [Auraticoccus cholistanensis]
MLRTALMMLTAASVLVASSVPAAHPSDETDAAADEPAVFRAPLDPDADPFMVTVDGRYHLMTTQGDRLTIKSAESIADLPRARVRTIWRGADDDPSRSTQIWAPALYRSTAPGESSPRWYVYYTASDGVDANHRMYVLESEGDDPTGPYHFKAKIADHGTYMIDGEPITVGGRQYFTWSAPGRGFEGGPQQIYLQPMDTPWSTSGPVVALPVERGTCPEVREGPTSIVHDGRLFLTYSSCDTGKPDYSVYAISIDADGDPTDLAQWRTHDRPLLQRHDAAGVFGPGHHSFFRSPDGTEDWIAYHAKNTSEYTYEWRSTRAARVGWDAEGLPLIDPPVALGTDVVVPSGDPGPGSRAINDFDEGTGLFEVEYAGEWHSGTGCGHQCYRGDDHWSWTTGSTATIRFTGTQIALFSVRDVGNGIAGISVDGRPEELVDLYSRPRSGQAQHWTSRLLPPGEHTVTVRVTGRKNPASGGTVVSLDRAEVWDDRAR